MANKVTVKVDLHGVEEDLLKIGPRIAKRLLRKAMKAVAVVAVEQIKALVPVDSGDLRESIGYTIKTKQSSDSAVLLIGPTFDKTAIKKGAGTTSSPGVYGMFVEFGVKAHKYTFKPYMRPTFDINADRWIQVFAENLKEDLEEAVKP